MGMLLELSQRKSGEDTEGHRVDANSNNVASVISVTTQWIFYVEKQIIEPEF